MTTGPQHIAHVGCAHNCPDACLIDVAVENLRAVRIAGNREHPFTRGALCSKVQHSLLDRVYSPDRLLYPVKRIGPKGPGAKFERISWDEGIATITQAMRAAIAEHGPQSILPYSFSGTVGIYQGWGFDRRFANLLGASRLDRTICDGAALGLGKYFPDLYLGFPPEGLVHSRLIVFWGSNPLTTGIHIWRWVLEAKRRGACVIAVDPYRSETARACDEHLCIRPGSDGALAMSMMKVIVDEGLVDRDYVERYTVGYAPLVERLRALSLPELAAACGLPIAKIQEFARLYAQTRPTAFRIGQGLQRCAGGASAIRALISLPALTGAWRDTGGGVCSIGRSWMFSRNAEVAERTDLVRPGTRTLNMMRLAEHLLDPTFTPPIKVLYLYNQNLLALPDQNSVRRALLRPDLFTALHDLFLTDSADYADVVLPATSFLEHADLVLSYGFDHGSFHQAAISPLGEAKPSAEVFQLLGRALGITDPALYLSAEEFTRDVMVNRQMSEAIVSQPFVKTVLAPNLRPRAEGGFATPSGKFEFYCEAMARDGFDPLPAFVPPHETLSNSRYPLNFLSRKLRDSDNSNYSHLPRLRSQEADLRVLEMHPQDAAVRGLLGGDEVRVFNDRGELRLPVKISPDVAPGTVATTWGWWDKLSSGRGVANNVTSAALTDIGGGATFYDCRVEVERWPQAAP